MAHRFIIESSDASVAGQLTQVLSQAELPQARLHALAILDGLGKLDAEKLGQVLADKHPYVRRLAFRLAEKFPDKGDYFAQFFDFESALKFSGYEPKLMLQQLFTAGFFPDKEIGESLGRFLSERFEKIRFPYFEAALLSSAHTHYDHVLWASSSSEAIF